MEVQVVKIFWLGSVKSLIMIFAFELVHKSCLLPLFLLADEDDLHDVISAVTGLAGRWQHLGSSLRLRSSDLEAILSASAHSPSDCLRKVLTLWLRQSYNVCIYNTHMHTLSTHPHLLPVFICHDSGS